MVKKLSFSIVTVSLLTTYSFGKNITSVENKKSPDFWLGKQTHPNFHIRAQDNKDMEVKVGARVQSTFENRKIEFNDNSKEDETFSDAYLRRVRFEFGVKFDKHTSFSMDIRNDKANYEDKGEQQFNVGDAYLKIKKPFGTSLVNFKFYRGKIDVSRTETVKSAYVIHYDRPHVADEAAQFITHNRRGTNAQMYGDWNKKIHYQIAFGDGVYSGKLKDATGSKYSKTGGKLLQESFFYGGKIVFSPIDGWEEKKRTETYMGQGKHLSVGVAYWNSSDINLNYTDKNGVKHDASLDHELTNVEFSAHYKGAFVQAEYFHFDGVVHSWSDEEIKTGTSDGWYATGEYFIEGLNIAPFIRYESWNKWEDEDDYDLTSTVAGLNWYLRGNSTKIGLTYQKDEYEKAFKDKSDERIKFTSQWFF